MPPITRLRGLVYICFFALLGVVLGYVPPLKSANSAVEPRWPPSRYEKKATDILRQIRAWNTTCPFDSAFHVFC